MALSPNLRGASLMAMSMAGFVLNDTALKYGGANFSVFQAMFVRGVFAVTLLLSLSLYSGVFSKKLHSTDHFLIGWRTLAEIGATLAFLTALFNMPLANATAILQITPLVIALAASLFLREPLGSKRVIIIFTGFIGVLIIIRPGTNEFNVYALFGLVAVGCAVARDLIVRKLDASVSSLVVAFVASFGIMLAGGIGVMLSQSWVTLAFWDIGLLALSAIFLVLGYYCAVEAMRVGDMGFVSSFRYSVLVWAIALGWLVFGDLPDLWTLVGMAILMGAGMCSIWYERRLAF